MTFSPGDVVLIPLSQFSGGPSKLRPALLLASPIFGREAPGFSHGDERPPRDVEIKKRLLQTGPILVGSGHAAEDTPSGAPVSKQPPGHAVRRSKAQPGQ